MSAATDIFERYMLSHVFGTGTYAKPTMLWVGLTKNTTYDRDGEDISNKEVANAGGYVRMPLAPSDSNWTDPVGTGSQVQNLAVINFPEATANWGMVSGMFVAMTGTWGTGVVIIHAPLTTPKDINNGEQFRFRVGDINIYLD